MGSFAAGAGTKFLAFTGESPSFTNATVTGNLTLSGGTANGVLYLNGSKVASSGTALAFNGSRLTVNTITVGLGGQTNVATNTAVGFEALNSASLTGGGNSAVGAGVLAFNTTGGNNSAVGAGALAFNTTGASNSAVGRDALFSNTTGSNNSAVGAGALAFNDGGNNNVGVGYQAGYSNTTGTQMVAIGYRAAFANTSGSNNIAVGFEALQANTTATNSTAVGYQALYNSNRTADANAFNTAVGYRAGFDITTGSKNTIIGAYTGNQGGLDIRTLSNRIVLSDGDGNPRWYVDNTGKAGYAPSNGGAVTQATSRATGVTLNKPSGQITLVSAAGTVTWQTFTVTNNTVESTDVIIVNQDTGANLYMIHVTAVAAGSFNITFATTGGTTTEQPVFNFAVIKAVAS